MTWEAESNVRNWRDRVPLLSVCRILHARVELVTDKTTRVDCPRKLSRAMGDHELPAFRERRSVVLSPEISQRDRVNGITERIGTSNFRIFSQLTPPSEEESRFPETSAARPQRESQNEAEVHAAPVGLDQDVQVDPASEDL
jgi:hypothetical protein